MFLKFHFRIFAAISTILIKVSVFLFALTRTVYFHRSRLPNPHLSHASFDFPIISHVMTYLKVKST